MASVRVPPAPRAAWLQSAYLETTNAAYAAARTSPLRAAAFYFGVALLFMRVSMLHQVLTRLTGVNIYLLYFVSIPALLGMLAAGGVGQTLRSRIGKYWLGYAIWLVISIPFSSWIGGSFGRVVSYLRTELLLLFVVAGLAVTWRECRILMTSLALGATTCIFVSRLFSREDLNERVSLQFGTIANANDFAAHLLAFLPFLLLVALSSKSALVRLLALTGTLAGIFVVVRTASRGAMVAIAVSLLFYLYRATPAQRFIALLLVPLTIAGVLVFMPGRVLQRLGSLRAAADTGIEAAQSSAARQDLLEQSLRYTLRRPVFGVGPAQFRSFEGQDRKIIGNHGRWQETHNTYTQISSECGIPALIFYLGAIFSAFGLMRRTYAEACRRPGCDDIRVAALCIGLSLLAYCVATTFLSFAYYFYLPALTGLAVVTARAAEDEFRTRCPGAPAVRLGV